MLPRRGCLAGSEGDAPAGRLYGRCSRGATLLPGQSSMQAPGALMNGNHRGPLLALILSFSQREKGHKAPKGRRDIRKAYFHTNDRAGLGAHVTDAALGLAYPSEPERGRGQNPPTRRGWDGGAKSLRQNYVDRVLAQLGDCPVQHKRLAFQPQQRGDDMSRPLSIDVGRCLEVRPAYLMRGECIAPGAMGSFR